LAAPDPAGKSPFSTTPVKGHRRPGSKTNSGAIAVNDFDGNYAHGFLAISGESFP